MKQDRRRARAIAIAAAETENRAGWLNLGLMTGVVLAVVGLAFKLLG
jgi:hypothetical protein